MKSSPYSVTSRSGSWASSSRWSSRRRSAPPSHGSTWIRPSAENSSGRSRPWAGCPVPATASRAVVKEGSGASGSHGESRTRAARRSPPGERSTSARASGCSPEACANCCSTGMSASCSASGPNVLSALRTVSRSAATRCTVIVHAGIVSPEKRSIPSRGETAHPQRRAAASTASRRTLPPARTKAGRKRARSGDVRPDSSRNQTVTPSSAGAMSNTHPDVIQGAPRRRGRRPPARARVPRPSAPAPAAPGAPRRACS